MKVDDQEAKVVRFFDRIAHNYDKKYETEDPLRYYFFTQRLEKSTGQLEFEGKSVLDIGSGTGALHDYLTSRHRIAGFYACDISEEMLNRSRIPQQQRFVGKAYQITFPIKLFDYIYMLGVSTYMTKDELEKTIKFMESNLKRDGMAIVSFTNRGSLDQAIRRMVRPLFKTMSGKNVVMQPFDLYAYSMEEIAVILERNWLIKRVDYLNQTIFPVNMILKKPSIVLAKYIERKLKNRRLTSLLSSDFLLFLKLRGASP